MAPSIWIADLRISDRTALKLFKRIRSQRVLVVLFPTEDPEIWNLGSACRA